MPDGEGKPDGGTKHTEGTMAAADVAHGLSAYASSKVPPLNLHTAFTQWVFAPGLTIFVVLAAAVYLYGVWRVRRDHPARPWPAWRTASFMAGLSVIAVSVQSSLGVYDDLLFSMHMWLHLLLLMVVPPLLLAGQPVTLLLHASRNPLHSWVKRLIRSRAVNVLTFPLFGVVLYTGVVAGTHLTGFMNLSLENSSVHEFEHVLYLLAGYLYFLPLISNEPIRWRLSSPARFFFLILAMPVDTFTGVVFTQTNHVMFPAYVGRRDWGPSLVGDLHNGGAVMWIAGDGIMLVLLLVFFLNVVRHREEIDAGRWIEGVRARRFRELAAADAVEPAMPAAVAEDYATEHYATERYATDDDDRELDAYNAYLARLNRGHESPTGSA